MLSKVIHTATITVNMACILQVIHPPHLSVCWTFCMFLIRAIFIQVTVTHTHAWGSSSTSWNRSRCNRTIWLRLRCKRSRRWCIEAKLRGRIRTAGLPKWWVHRIGVRWLTCGWVSRVRCIVTWRIWGRVWCWVRWKLWHSRVVYVTSKSRIQRITKLGCSLMRWRVKTRIRLLGRWHSRTSLWKKNKRNTDISL